MEVMTTNYFLRSFIIKMSKKILTDLQLERVDKIIFNWIAFVVVVEFLIYFGGQEYL